MDARSALDAAIAERTPQAPSLVSSVFGDVVDVHGGAVWLGTLVGWLERFGIAERNTRTAVTRMVNEGWLARRAHGRRSELGLAPAGASRTREAGRRIYRARPERWKGEWSLLLLGACSLSAPARDRLRRELRLMGFGELAPEILLHPAAELAELERVLGEHGVAADAHVLAAGAHPGWLPEADAEAQAALVARSWRLDALGERYADFVRRFTPIERALGSTPDPESAFRARVLAIHEYRPVVLRDPQLPAELLPGDWPGLAARALLERVYRRTGASSAAWIQETGACAAGPLPPATAEFRRRFRQSGDGPAAGP